VSGAGWFPWRGPVDFWKLGMAMVARMLMIEITIIISIRV
jgi:hypothetical protein